jgi:hypothetical protein
MINFFRKIRKKMADDNKPLKYMRYAIGEIALLVIGILIALQINTWNEERKDSKKEFILLKQMKADFETNQQFIEEGLEEVKIHTIMLQLTLNHTGPEVEMPEPEILDSIDNLNYTSLELVYGTINLNLTTDQKDILKNDTLKTLLSSFPGLYASYKEYELVSKEITLQQRHEHHKHVAILSMRPDLQSMTQTPHKSDHLGWLRDRDYQNIVMDRLFQIESAADKLMAVRVTNENILKLINHEITRFD